MAREAHGFSELTDGPEGSWAGGEDTGGRGGLLPELPRSLGAVLWASRAHFTLVCRRLRVARTHAA